MPILDSYINAVYRNKKKRQIRSIIDNLEKDYIKKQDYIIILREKGKYLEYQELNHKLKSLLIIKGKDQR